MRGLARRAARVVALATSVLLALLMPLPGRTAAVDGYPPPWLVLHQAGRLLREGEPAMALAAVRALEGAFAGEEVAPALAGDHGWSRWKARILEAEAWRQLEGSDTSGFGLRSAAVAAARAAVALAVTEPERVEAQLHLAAALAGTEDPAERLQQLRLLLELAGSPQLVYHGPVLDRLLADLQQVLEDPGSDSLLRRLAPHERLAYGRLLYRFGRWEAGLGLFRRPLWDPGEPEPVVEQARGLAALGRREEAIQVLRAALEQVPPGPARFSLLDALAGHLWRAGEPREAARLDLRLWREGPPAHRAAALRRLVEALTAGDARVEAVLAALGKEGRNPERTGAATRVRRLQVARRLLVASEGLDGHPAYADALWSLFLAARFRPPAGEGAGAGAALEAWALAALARAGAEEPRVLYWQARRGDRAARERLLTRYPLSGYAWLVQEHDQGDTRPGEAVAAPGGAPCLLPLASHAGELPPVAGDPAEVAWLEAVAGQLRRRLASSGERPPWVYATLAWTGARRGAYREAAADAARWAALTGGVARVWRAACRGGEGEGDARQAVAILRYLYPRPWEARVQELAGERGLPVELLYAVIRAESTYEPLAVSTAGARGLMQVLPRTATWIADRLLAGREGTGGLPETLYDSEVNLRLGSAYLGWLLSRYGDVHLAVAAYHAGQGNVDRWLAAALGRPWAGTGAGADRGVPRQGPPLAVVEEVIERLAGPATREYVHRVYGAYRTYLALTPLEEPHRLAVSGAGGPGDPVPLRPAG